MKWLSKDLNPFSIVCCACITLSIASLTVSAQQSYNNNNNNNYYNNYNNHPAYRRQAYLYGGRPYQYRPTNAYKYQSAYSANAIADANTSKRTGKATYNTKYNDNSNNNYGVAATTNSQINYINKADAENAKFAGAQNQEPDLADESERTLGHKKLKRLRRLLANRCLPFGRDDSNALPADTNMTPEEMGRFLWDVNVYNVYGSPPLAGGFGGGCAGLLAGGLGGGLGGGLLGGPAGLGGGLLADPIAPIYPVSPLTNFLSLFAPGILQNTLAAPVVPLAAPAPDPAALQNDPNVAPGYQPFPQRRPTQVYFDSAGAPPITPAQLFGGVATTVNGIIQQLTGNIQPVYQQPYG